MVSKAPLTNPMFCSEQVVSGGMDSTLFTLELYLNKAFIEGVSLTQGVIQGMTCSVRRN